MKLFILSLLFSFPLYALDGLVEKKEFRLPQYKTVKGDLIHNVVIGFETYGTLNTDKSNAILITHHYSGTSHAAGNYSEKDASPGYWDSIIGRGKPIDTDKYFVISSDTLANVNSKDPNVRTTGPRTTDPKTGKAFGGSFPSIKLSDFVKVQRELIGSLGIKKLHAVVGASSGAAQAIEWGAVFPDQVGKVIAVVPPGLSLPKYVVALLNRWCAPIILNPEKGLIESVKHLTLSSVYFDWGPEDSSKIEAALEEKARVRAGVMDPVSFLYTAWAIQTFDVEALAQNIKAPVLFIPAEKDMIFPPELSEKAAEKLRSLGKKADVFLLKGRVGHLDGISGITQASDVISKFLKD